MLIRKFYILFSKTMLNALTALRNVCDTLLHKSTFYLRKMPSKSNAKRPVIKEKIVSSRLKEKLKGHWGFKMNVTLRWTKK